MTQILVETADLATPATIARRLGVTRAAVHAWAKRYADFPRPIIELDDGRTRLYSWAAVKTWNDATAGGA